MTILETTMNLKRSNRVNIEFADLIYKQPSRNQQLKEAFDRVLYSGNFILGKELDNFENQFAKYLEVKYCIGVGNGLEALQIALMSLDIGKGDEIITTPITAAATTLAILAVGATPVFVDTNKCGLIDVELIEKVITKKTKAILPVHLYGNSVDLNRLIAICQKYKLFLIEDTAQAYGSKFNDKFLGTFGTLGCFSFYPTKNLGALGDGGAIVTNNLKFATICRQIRNYGESKKYKHLRFGLNSRLDELQAALLSIKLKYLEEDNSIRRSLAQRYINNLLNLPQVEIVMSQNGSLPNFHLFVIKVQKRSALRKYLSSYNIPTLIHYPKILPDQPFLKGLYKFTDLKVARNFVKSCLSLPLHPQMSLKQIDFISSKIRELYEE